MAAPNSTCKQSQRSMLKIIIFSFLIISNCRCFSQTIYNAIILNKNNYYKTTKPKKTIQTITYYSLNGKGFEKCITLFNASGMAISQEIYSHNGWQKNTYTNDTFRKIRLSKIIEGNYFGGFKFKEIYTYDENNHLTRITISFSTNNSDTVGRVCSTVVLKNNEKGQPIEAVEFYQSNDTLETGNISTAKYLVNKNKVEISFPADSLRNETFFIINYGIFVPGFNEIYDSLGELVSFQQSNGSLTKYEIAYKYDKYGNYKRIKIYSRNLSVKGRKSKKVAKVVKLKYEY